MFQNINAVPDLIIFDVNDVTVAKVNDKRNED